MSQEDGKTREDEQRILDTARELCQLKFQKNYDLRTVARSTNVPWDQVHFPPGLRKHTLLLPASLKDMLETDEWKALIASSFVQIRILARPTWAIPFLLWLMAPLFLLALVMIPVSFSLGPQKLLSDVLLPTVGILTILRAARLSKKTLHRFDERTAKLLGREALLKVLQKVDKMGWDGVERPKRRRRLLRSFWWKPTITERIKNLEAMPADG